jgi:uncharacterized membrane protein YqgA involved in biofilm formation
VTSAFLIGAFLNALGILFGSLYGLATRNPVSAATQHFFKASLGCFTVFLGLWLVFENVQGSFGAGLKQLFLAATAVIVGYWIGKLLRLQQFSNRLGRLAGRLIDAAQKNPPGSPLGGFLSATILFCAAPLGFLGVVTDGTIDFFFLLGLKAVMDGLAMTTFVRLFRWPAALSAIPVFGFLYGLTLAIHFYALPWLTTNDLVHPVNTTAGCLACVVALVIFEVRRVELANYLPALIVAPLLAWWLA